MENMYQQAILDAKSLRASAMANAKSALEEAFEPRIQEMVRLKLSEELDGEAIDEDENLDDLSEENIEGLEEDDEVNDSELDAILAELDSLSEEDNTIADEELVSESCWLDEAEEDKEDETEKDDAEEDEEVEDEVEDEETKEITVPLSALKNVLDTIKSLSPDIDSEEVSDEEFSDEELPDGEEVDSEEEEETISLDEILAELEEEDAKSVEESKMKTELKEAKKIIKVLHESLSEVNLLNAKLLFMNKLFKSKTLTESQKVNVVKSFDKASTVKEVKYTYEVLKESIAVSKKSPIRESFGYASKPAGVSPNRNVIEADPFVARWQKIAGI